MKIFRITLIVWMGLCIQGVFGQRSLDTIYVNEHQTVSLFFPSPIQRGVTGNEQFVFSYDREDAGHLGLLQGMDGEKSNLLVITTDGMVYAFILAYVRSLPQLNYFINEAAAIGLERPVSVKNEKDGLMVGPKPYESLCKLLLDRESKNMGTVLSNGIRLRLEEMIYDGNVVYLIIGIKNRSDIDFEMERLDFFQVNGSKKRRASHQEISLGPLYSCNRSTLVKSGEEIRLAYVLPKFVLGKGESLKLVLEEEHGNRRVVLVK